MSILTNNQFIKDTYSVERLIGEGAFAEVYRVKHRFMGRQAMKVFRISGKTQEDLETDLYEALLLSSMKHPNIIEVYDANVFKLNDHNYGYFTMSYMPGGTLDRYWRSFDDKLVPVKQVVDIIKQVCRGLDVAHSSTPPMIHRDIKPQNILIGYDRDGLIVKLSDFGLAKSVNPLTLIATSKGTLGFKPPEAFKNIDSCAGDVWSLGTTFYLLLTDEMPYPIIDEELFGGQSLFEKNVRPPSYYNINVDSKIDEIIHKCLEKDLTKRYQNASSLLKELEEWSPKSKFDKANYSQSQSKFGPKSALAINSNHDFKKEARIALNEAIEISKNPSGLMLAADLLEEAISKDPELRIKYQDRLDLWKKGVMHVSTNNFSKLKNIKKDNN